MAKYELMLIVESSVTEEKRNTSISELKALLEKNEAKITKEDVW